MTELEMRNRIKEIDEIRSKLADEKRGYEIKLAEQRNSDAYKTHKEFEGKCFETLNLKNNDRKEIKAFKILKVLEPHHENYAECLVIVDGIERTCWNVQAMKIEVLPIWCPNIDKMISNPNDPKMIDMYKMIDEKEFMDIHYRCYLEKFVLLQRLILD